MMPIPKECKEWSMSRSQTSSVKMETCKKLKAKQEQRQRQKQKKKQVRDTYPI